MNTNDAASRRHVPQMDGLRGVACLIVLIGHAVVASIPQTAEALRGVPKIGVWIFFVLSAFLLTVRLGSVRPGPTGMIDYVAARILRIVPPFVAAVLIYHAVGQPGLATWPEVVQVLTFQATMGHLWTIPVETSFYVVLPVLVAVLSPLRPAGRIAVLIALAVVAGTVMPPTDTPYNSTNVGWYLGTFLAGTAAGQVALAWRGGPMPGWIPLVSILTTIGLAVGARMLSSDPGHVLINMHWIFAGPVAVLVLSLYMGDGVMTRLLSARPLISIGHASYSIYLVHMAFVNLLQGLPYGLGVPTSLALSVLAGSVGLKFVEKPLSGLRFALTKRGRDARRSGSAAVRLGPGARTA